MFILSALEDGLTFKTTAIGGIVFAEVALYVKFS